MKKIHKTNVVCCIGDCRFIVDTVIVAGSEAGFLWKLKLVRLMEATHPFQSATEAPMFRIVNLSNVSIFLISERTNPH